MKKYIFLIFNFLLIIGFILIIKNKTDYSDILFENKKEYGFDVSHDKIQKKIDEEIIEYISDKNITFNSPKVILDPYKTSPLSALIIFYTKNSTEIKLYINNEFMTTIESSNSYVIPIYGLRLGYRNKVVLEDVNGDKKTLYIETKKIIDNVFYTYETSIKENENLFLNSSSGKYMIDNNGNIVWYMDINNTAMYLKQKKLYFVDKYNSIIKTDFMGRVYKKYHTMIEYDTHNMEILDNDNIMVIDGDKRIVEINNKTGKIVKTIDIYEILKRIDRNFDIKDEKFYVNYFQYNKKNNTILISVRTLNAVIDYDLNTKKIIWIFSNHPKLSSKFDKYKLKLIKGDYFIGQHTPYLDGNYLYVFNNNVFSTGSKKDINISKTSEAIIYEIDKMTAKEVYKYESDYLGGWYGNFFEEDNYKNINFGCIINDDLGKYSKIIELDKENNVITNFTTKHETICIYQSFREKFYDETTPNYKVDSKYNVIIENLDELREKYDVLNFKYNKKTKEFINNITNSYIDETIIEYSNAGLLISTFDDFELIFINDKFNYFSTSLSKDNKFIAFKKLYYNIYFSEIRGKYAVYIKVNDKYYNSNFVLNFN